MIWFVLAGAVSAVVNSCFYFRGGRQKSVFGVGGVVGVEMLLEKKK